MTSPIVENSLHLTISTSVGIARSDYDCDSVESLMRRADTAMYCAKNQRRTRHYWFDAYMQREINVRNRLGAGDRKSGVSGKSGLVRVELGGGGFIKKKKIHKYN